MPTWGARLRVASHVVGVVFEGHNDVGDRWVPGPLFNGLLVRPTKVFLYVFCYMMEQLKDSPAYFFRLPEATSRRRFSPILMARLV